MQKASLNFGGGSKGGTAAAGTSDGGNGGCNGGYVADDDAAAADEDGDDRDGRRPTPGDGHGRRPRAAAARGGQTVAARGATPPESVLRGLNARGRPGCMALSLLVCTECLIKGAVDPCWRKPSMCVSMLAHPLAGPCGAHRM